MINESALDNIMRDLSSNLNTSLQAMRNTLGNAVMKAIQEKEATLLAGRQELECDQKAFRSKMEFERQKCTWIEP